MEDKAGVDVSLSELIKIPITINHPWGLKKADWVDPFIKSDDKLLGKFEDLEETLKSANHKKRRY